MVVTSRELANTYNFPPPQTTYSTATPHQTDSSMNIEEHQPRECSSSPGNNKYRSQSTHSSSNASSIDYAEQMETQATSGNWAEQVDEEVPATPFQFNIPQGHNEANTHHMASCSIPTDNLVTPLDLEPSTIPYQANQPTDPQL